MTRRFVENSQEIRITGLNWRDAVANNPNLVRSLLRRTRYWVFDPDLGLPIPSKFAGFADMTGERYARAVRSPDEEGGAYFNGTATRRAVQRATGRRFEKPAKLPPEYQNLPDRLIAWGEGCISGIFKDVVRSKWRFLVLPPTTDPRPVHVIVPESDVDPDDEWEVYEEAWDHYEETWWVFSEVLVDMCRTYPGHQHLAEVVAKVGISARAYAAGLERHGDGSGAGTIVNIAQALQSRHELVDNLIDQLRGLGVGGLDASMLEQVVQIHGEFLKICSEVTRDGNAVRSWASKYLFFHAQCVPIYDSRANTILRSWYSLRGKRNWHFDMPEGADTEYYAFCNRFLSLWDDAVDDGKEVSVRRLDQYLLYWYDLKMA